MQGWGCGITNFSSNLTFTRNTTFLGNKIMASSPSYRFYCDVAICASASSLHFSGGTNIINSSSPYGGAVLVQANTVILVTLFIIIGGGICAEVNVVYLYSMELPTLLAI